MIPSVFVVFPGEQSFAFQFSRFLLSLYKASYQFTFWSLGFMSNSTITCTIWFLSQFRPMLPTTFWTKTWIGKWAWSPSPIPWTTWLDLQLGTGASPWTRTSTWRWAAKTLPPHSLWPCGPRHCPSAPPSTSPTLRRWTTRRRWCLTPARIQTCIRVMMFAWTLTCSMATWPLTHAQNNLGRRPTAELSKSSEIC